MGLAAPAGRGRPGRQRLHAGCATSSRRVGWGVRGHRGAVEAANAGAFWLRRPRTTAIPHPHLFQETQKLGHRGGRGACATCGWRSNRATSKRAWSSRARRWSAGPAAPRVRGTTDVHGCGALWTRCSTERCWGEGAADALCRARRPAGAGALGGSAGPLHDAVSTRWWSTCSTSTTLAARVASFENATGLPQKDRTRAFRFGARIRGP